MTICDVMTKAPVCIVSSDCDNRHVATVWHKMLVWKHPDGGFFIHWNKKRQQVFCNKKGIFFLYLTTAASKQSITNAVAYIEAQHILREQGVIPPLNNVVEI